MIRLQQRMLSKTWKAQHCNKQFSAFVDDITHVNVFSQTSTAFDKKKYINPTATVDPKKIAFFSHEWPDFHSPQNLQI